MVTSQPALIPAKTECSRNPLGTVAAGTQASAAHILEAGLDALSLLHIGLVICNAAGVVLETNRIAKEILEQRDGLELSAEKTLSATREGARPITEIVQQVAKSQSAQFGSRDAVLAVGRGADKRPLTLFVRPSRSRAQDADAKVSVLVMILDSALPVRTIELELRQLYGFTSTEAQLANLLMEGKSFEECCQELGVLRSTGCTHLRRVFKKTGVHRQSELVGLLLRAIGLAFLGEQETKPSPMRQEIQRARSRPDAAVVPVTL